MALYALGDLHLSFQANKPMDAFGKAWKRHEQKIEKYVNQIVKPEDTLVLTGDHSWGGEGSLKNAAKIWHLSKGCRGARSCFAGITTCSGMRKRQIV